ENYRKLLDKAKEVEGFIKTFAETCRPDNKDIAILDTKGKELNKISNILSVDVKWKILKSLNLIMKGKAYKVKSHI
ncbi:MAG: hypothetical protein ACRC30_02295, partial [Clostridium sp.]